MSPLLYKIVQQTNKQKYQLNFFDKYNTLYSFIHPYDLEGLLSGEMRIT